MSYEERLESLEKYRINMMDPFNRRMNPFHPNMPCARCQINPVTGTPADDTVDAYFCCDECKRIYMTEPAK